MFSKIMNHRSLTLLRIVEKVDKSQWEHENDKNGEETYLLEEKISPTYARVEVLELTIASD